MHKKTHPGKNNLLDCTGSTGNEEDLHSCIVNTDKVSDKVEISGGEYKKEQDLALARDTCTRACLPHLEEEDKYCQQT